MLKYLDERCSEKKNTRGCASSNLREDAPVIIMCIRDTRGEREHGKYKQV